MPVIVFSLIQKWSGLPGRAGNKGTVTFSPANVDIVSQFPSDVVEVWVPSQALRRKKDKKKEQQQEEQEEQKGEQFPSFTNDTILAHSEFGSS